MYDEITIVSTLFDFLDKHNGALMVIITLVYVVATVLIWIANSKSAQATHDQLEESKRQFEETKKANQQQLEAMRLQLEESKRQYAETKRLDALPYLQLRITGNNAGPGLVLKYLPHDCLEEQSDVSAWCSFGGEITNIGRGVAKNIYCHVKDCKPYHNKDYKIISLQPGDIKELVFILMKRDDEEPPQAISFTIIYKDLFDYSYRQLVDIYFKKSTVLNEYRVNDCIVHLPELTLENQEAPHA